MHTYWLTNLSHTDAAPLTLWTKTYYNHKSSFNLKAWLVLLYLHISVNSSLFVLIANGLCYTRASIFYMINGRKGSELPFTKKILRNTDLTQAQCNLLLTKDQRLPTQVPRKDVLDLFLTVQISWIGASCTSAMLKPCILQKADQLHLEYSHILRFRFITFSMNQYTTLFLKPPRQIYQNISMVVVNGIQRNDYSGLPRWNTTTPANSLDNSE